MTKYNKMNKLDVRWQHGPFMGLAMRADETTVTGPDGNERPWTFRRLLEDKKNGT